MSEMTEQKHSAFVTIDGINRVMRIYEQVICDFSDLMDGTYLCFQFDGKQGIDTIVYSKQTGY